MHAKQYGASARTASFVRTWIFLVDGFVSGDDHQSRQSSQVAVKLVVHRWHLFPLKSLIVESEVCVMVLTSDEH